MEAGGGPLGWQRVTEWHATHVERTCDGWWEIEGSMEGGIVERRRLGRTTYLRYGVLCSCSSVE